MEQITYFQMVCLCPSDGNLVIGGCPVEWGGRGNGFSHGGQPMVWAVKCPKDRQAAGLICFSPVGGACVIKCEKNGKVN